MAQNRNLLVAQPFVLLASTQGWVPRPPMGPKGDVYFHEIQALGACRGRYSHLNSGYNLCGPREPEAHGGSIHPVQ